MGQLGGGQTNFEWVASVLNRLNSQIKQNGSIDMYYTNESSESESFQSWSCKTKLELKVGKML